MESLVDSIGSEVRNQLRKYENATTNADTTEQTWRWCKNREGDKCKKGEYKRTREEKYCTDTKRLKHAMLRNNLAEEASLADIESNVDRSERASQPG